MMARSYLVLLGACLVAWIGCVTAHGSSSHNLYGLVGRWQGVCIKKAYESHCIDDIISYPYYVEYSWNQYDNKYYMQYRQDAVTTDTWSNYGTSQHYETYSYSDRGSCQAWKSTDGYCIDVSFDSHLKRSYRAKVKHEGELDVMIEEGEWGQQSNQEYIWGKCASQSWRHLKCGSHSYTYRCYLVRASSWSWSW